MASGDFDLHNDALLFGVAGVVFLDAIVSVGANAAADSAHAMGRISRRRDGKRAPLP